MNLHLTPEQIDDHLIGDLAPAPAAHLAACPQCQAAVAEAGAPLATFRDMSLAWAERRSATMPNPAAAAPARAPSHRVAWASLSAVATATVVIALAIPFAHRGTAHPANPAGPAVASAPAASSAPSTASADEIARDNQMLAAIDQALSTPVRPVGIVPRAHARANSLHG